MKHRITITAVLASAAIAAAGCASTTSTTQHASHHKAKAQPVAVVTTTTTSDTNDATCQILRGDWDRTRAHLQRGEYAYAGGAWADIAKDFQALGMTRDYKASEDISAVLIDVATGQTITSQQTKVLAAGVKQINIDGSTKCGGNL